VSATGTWWSLRAVVAVLVHPELWPTALRVMWRLAPSQWWRRAPHLPLPDPDYLHFRLVTAYGGDGTTPARGEDLVTYLRWCRAWPSLLGRR
jgi:hypothetical protein